MKFIRYINESSILPGIYGAEANKKFVDTIKRECEPYIKDIKNSDAILGRWTEREVVGVKEFTPRTDRKPTDTPLWMQEYLDSFFYKKFGWKARSEGVFAVPIKKSDTRSFAPFYPMFPAGEYKFVWSPEVTDLFLSLNDMSNDYTHHSLKMLHSFPKDVVFKLKLNELLETYRDISIKEFFEKGIPGSREIMIKCKSYYLISENTAKEILEILNEI